MTKFSKLGATALAIALSFTMVAPVTAKADYEDDHYSVHENTFYDRDYNGTYDEDGDFTATTEIYKNKVTGDTYTWKKGEKWDGDAYRKATKSWFGNPKKVQVGVKGAFKFQLSAESGQEFDGKLKVKSGKGLVKVKQLGKTESEVLPVYDSNAKQYYFTKNDGTKEYVGNLTQDQVYAAKRTRYSYTYAIYGKKAGSAKLQYKIAGKKYKIKVTVTDDSRPFKSITFAGKSYQLDYNTGATNPNYYAKQSSNKAGNFYTNKKKGKFRVTMNKNYKFVAMYVLKDTDYETTNYTYDKNGYDGSSIDRKAVNGIDLNNDGDFEDEIDGITEKSYENVSFTKYTKKSPKIKLNTSFEKIDTNTTRYDGAGKTNPVKYSQKYTGDVADTTILIVYQNKITKGYGLKTITINYRKAVK
ncbi:MAG: hypothetical protein K6E70_00420 [Butyrivibrio sp.]|nr:hypothetical protein [Butyrivibrio sp.]